MEIDTKIKGWDFQQSEKSTEEHFDFDGSASLDELRSELNTHESRLAELQGLIVKNQNIIAQKREDANILMDLGWLKRRKWEKENGTTVEAAANILDEKAQEIESTLTALVAEQKRLPNRIDSLKSQIEILIRAEGKGIEKGIDPQAAKQLGEIEVAKQKQNLEYQRQQQLKQSAKQNEDNDKKNSSGGQAKWFIIAGVSLVVIVGIILAIKKFKSNQLKTIAG